MICLGCKRKVEDYSKVCRWCGASLITNGQVTTPEQSTAKQVSQSAKGCFFMLAGIGFTIATIALFPTGVFWIPALVLALWCFRRV